MGGRVRRRGGAVGAGEAVGRNGWGSGGWAARGGAGGGGGVGRGGEEGEGGGRRVGRRGGGGDNETARTLAARVSARRLAWAWSLASTMMRTVGSVPLGRTSTRPEAPSSA